MENDSQANEVAVFDLDLSDHDLIQTIKKPINDSKKFWNGKRGDNGFDLDERRKRNLRAWSGEHYEGISMYDHNVPYVDNRIFPNIETIAPIVANQIPQIQALPNGDSVTQIRFAQDIEKIMKRWAETQEFEDKMTTGVRNVQLDYVAIFKQRWDENAGRNGEVILELLEAEDVIVDHNARMYENPRFVAHRQTASVQELIFKFPEKENDILQHFAIKQKRTTQMTELQEYWETWFTYYEDDGTPKEGVAWLLDFTLVLGKMENPNWEEENEEGVRKNYLDAPVKPFFFLNVFNKGKHKIDNNAAIDQAWHQQKIVNKRGRQIVENADQSGSGIVYNTSMIGKKDMAKLIGAPDEKVGVKGDVNRAFARMSPPLLPQYVVEDKFDARNEIDNFFGAHDVSQGRGGGKTATQDVLQVEKDNSRQSMLVRGVERVSLQIFRHTIQMMKVYYVEDHYFTITGENGQFDMISMKNDDIEDGLDITIIRGSTLPNDRASNIAKVENAAAIGFADPYTYWEVMQTGVIPSPQTIVKRLVDWSTDQAKFVQSARDDEFNREAMIDIKVLNAGEEPKVRSEPQVEYIDFRKKYLLSGDFQDLEPAIQMAHIKHLEASIENAQRMLSLQQGQLLGSEEEGQPVAGMLGQQPVEGGLAPMSPAALNQQQAPAQGVMGNGTDQTLV